MYANLSSNECLYPQCMYCKLIELVYIIQCDYLSGYYCIPIFIIESLSLQRTFVILVSWPRSNKDKFER